MGQQQLLLIILGVIIVGIAIAVGLSLFSAQSVQSNSDAIINDLNNLAAQAYQFRIRPIYCCNDHEHNRVHGSICSKRVEHHQGHN